MANPDASAAEAAERWMKAERECRERSEKVAKLLESAVSLHRERSATWPDLSAAWLASIVTAAITELRTPVGREKNQ